MKENNTNSAEARLRVIRFVNSAIDDASYGYAVGKLEGLLLNLVTSCPEACAWVSKNLEAYKSEDNQ